MKSVLRIMYFQLFFNARQYYHDGGTVEIDDEPIVSTILDEEENIVGAYVQAWVWVDKPVGEQDAGDE